MSNTANRGQETTLRVAIDGRLQTGTFLRTKEFTWTPKTDIVEDDYIGEAQTEVDIQHHGHGLSFTMDEDDASALDFLTELCAREEAHELPQQITITAITTYRDGVTRPRVIAFPDVAMKVSTRTVGGRKERVPWAFEAACKTHNVLVQ